MDFNFSEEQTMMSGVLREFLDAECTMGELRKQIAADVPRDEQRWGKLAEMGLFTVLLPEDAGGLGLAEQDFVLLAEAAGYANLPEALIEHAGVAAPLLAALAPDHELVAKAAAGEVTLIAGDPATAYLPNVDSADALLLWDGKSVHLVPASAVKAVRQESVDPLRRLFKVTWTPSDATRLGGDNATAWAQAVNRGTLFSAAHCIGAAQRCVDMGVDYTKDRNQFGKPIGSYQAVKHLLARAQVKIEFAKPVVYAAAGYSEPGTFADARISHAKIAATEAADAAARASIQVQGAMGYSWEVDVHFFLKRVMSLTYAWGGPEFHLERINKRVTELPLGPDQTFGAA